MNKNRFILSIITILIIAGVGVVLRFNPLDVRKTNEYGNKIAAGFPADFPGDPNIIEIIKNQKISSLTGGTEFVLEYLTTKPPTEIFQNITSYALSKNLNNIYDGSGTDEDGIDYFYFIAENDAKTEKISAKVSVLPDSGDALSRAEMNILNK